MGPPGTGKSQTIVNLIAKLCFEGKRVLFVAEKKAALDVVLKRLNAAGLGHMALDLHGADISRASVLARIDTALTAMGETRPVDDRSLHQDFAKDRDRLNAHVERLHVKREPSGLSVFDLQARVLAVRDRGSCRTRWRAGQLERRGSTGSRPCTGGCTGNLLDSRTCSSGPALRVRRADIRDGAAANLLIDAVNQLTRESLPAAERALRNAWPFGTEMSELTLERNPTTRLDGSHRRTKSCRATARARSIWTW